MASLVQRDDIFYLQYCLSGKVRRRSLGTTSLQIAREHLRQFESAQLRWFPRPARLRSRSITIGDRSGMVRGGSLVPGPPNSSQSPMNSSSSVGKRGVLNNLMGRTSCAGSMSSVPSAATRTATRCKPPRAVSEMTGSFHSSRVSRSPWRTKSVMPESRARSCRAHRSTGNLGLGNGRSVSCDRCPAGASPWRAGRVHARDFRRRCS